MSKDVIVKINNLKKTYGNKEVLKGINLEIKKGDIVGYIGTNGAGKSTTVKILLGLVDDYEGEIEIFGENIKGNNNYKKYIGYVPEISDMYDVLTPREYFLFIGRLYGLEENIIEERAKAMLKIFFIEESYNSRISSFSKGMRQKILIIASMIHNPSLLFFDEPLTGLDANSVVVFKDILNSLSKRGKTIFYSSHIMDVVEKVSNRIVLLDDGMVRVDGSFEDLIEQSKELSLENIFNKLTGFNKHEELTEDFISILENE